MPNRLASNRSAGIIITSTPSLVQTRIQIGTMILCYSAGFLFFSPRPCYTQYMFFSVFQKSCAHPLIINNGPGFSLFSLLADIICIMAGALMYRFFFGFCKVLFRIKMGEKGKKQALCRGNDRHISSLLPHQNGRKRQKTSTFSGNDRHISMSTEGKTSFKIEQAHTYISIDVDRAPCTGGVICRYRSIELPV